jgi:hypothetical protein
MSTFTFRALARPFPRWAGPFSPARGTRSGFRFHQGRLGTWVENQSGMSFWSVADGHGARAIATLVRDEWGGGRVLFLPNGFVVKPLQKDDEVGRRALIGRFHGALVLERPNEPPFNMSTPGAVQPGKPWHGPTTTGLECAIQSDGSLVCSWYHPTQWGRDEVSEPLRGPDHSLAAGFRAARPGAGGGRVRITGNGHVITNRQELAGTWVCIYVGYVDASSWARWDHWIEKERI